MFYDCESLKSLNISNWNFFNQEDGQDFLDNCDSLTNITYNNIVCGFTFPNWLTYAILEHMGSSSKVDLSTWNVSNVNIMDYALCDFPSNTELDISTWDTGNVTSMTDIFGMTPISEITIYVSDSFETTYKRIFGEEDWRIQYFKKK